MEIQANPFVALALAPTGAGPVEVAPAGPVDAGQVELFRSLLRPADETGGGLVAPLAAEGRMDVGRPLPPTEPPANMGEAILRGMDEIRVNFRKNWETVTSLGGPGKPLVSPQELFQFQLKVIESSFQYEMVGKVVSKAEQNLEQIVKMQ